MKERAILTDHEEKLARSIAEMEQQDFQEIKENLLNPDPEVRDIYLTRVKQTASIMEITAKEVLENIALVRAEDALAKDSKPTEKIYQSENSLSLEMKRDLVTKIALGNLSLLEGISLVAEKNEISTKELLQLIESKEKKENLADTISPSVEGVISAGISTAKPMAEATHISTLELIQMLLITENQLSRILGRR